MGYSKIVQFGNVTEVFQYDKPLPDRHNFKPQSPIKKKRARDIRQAKLNHPYLLYEPTKRSKNRTLDSFFKLCHHNNVNSTSIHFVTLTFTYDISYKKALSHLRRFMERVQEASSPIPIRYISVPEQTKEGRVHFHLLVYDLPSRVSGEPIWSEKKKRYVGTTERTTRYLQRLYGRGYLDICPATYTSRGIAGYMAKYMAKSFECKKFEASRKFNCSRNILKVSAYGSNSLDSSLIAHFVHTQDLVESDVKLYDVPYMGECLKTTIVKILN